MDIIPLLAAEFSQESEITKRMFERIPDDQWDWKPHPKSMSLKSLVVHLAELPSWVKMGLTTEEIDFAGGYQPTEVNNKEELIKLLEHSIAEGSAALSQAKEEDLLPKWTLRTGDHIHMVMTKYEVIRHSLSQTIHHRAQLGVYLRLLGIPLVKTYGPTADEASF